MIDFDGDAEKAAAYLREQQRDEKRGQLAS